MRRSFRIFLCLALTLGGMQQAQAAVEVKTTRLGHGVKAWYAESAQVPVIDIEISLEGAGYASDPAGKEGRAALAAAMLTQGAGSLDALQFQQALEDGAIQLDTQLLADRLIIRLHCLRDQVARGGELLSLALSQPRLAAADLAREKTSLSTQISQLEETPDYRTDRLLETTGFSGHPYANAPYGHATSIATLTAEDVRQYFTTYAVRGNVLIAAAGDVDASLLDTTLTPVINALRDGEPAPLISQTSLKATGTTVRETMEVPQTVVMFASEAIARDDSRFYTAYVLNHILGGDGLIARLANRVRQQKGLVYGIDTQIDIRRGIPMLRGGFATRNASAEEAIDAVKQVLSELHDRGVTTEECTDAKTYIIGSNALRLDSSRSISDMLLSMQINRLGEDYLTQRKGYFEAVSCAEVSKMAAELLDPSRFLFARVGGETAPKASP